MSRLPPPTVRWLGRQPYDRTLAAMRAYTDARGPDHPDEFWFLEHEPVYTQGQAGRPEHLLNPRGIPVVASDRGGQITYHGPGQWTVYTLIDLRRLGVGVRGLVDRIEGALIALLAAQGIVARADPEAPGVYVGEAKLASLGLRVRRQCSYHGLALNVDMDLTPFHGINPCGRAGQRMTQLRDLGITLGMTEVGEALRDHLLARFGYRADQTAAVQTQLPILI